ncbi:MAG: hypothetical protein H6Q90_5706, partial [Deltaproteobacteria bacterium]|nr:hypothetical protein [Deltaproteobacteria bacterium]
MRERYPLEMLLLLALGACSFDPPGIAPQDAQGDSRAGQDVTPGDGSALDRHALITEVNALGAFGFIEIYNPTTTAIDLSAYYLSDCNEYWKLPGQQAGNASIILQLSDFLVKFPPGQMLTAGGVATIAIDGPAFENEYTSLPTYTIGVPIAGSTAMIPTVIPAGTPDPQITDSGEMVVLVHWDGTSDRVEDVDL